MRSVGVCWNCVAVILACAAAACAGGRPRVRAAAPEVSAARVGPQVVALMPEFWSFLTRAEGAAGPERIRLLKELALAPHRELYEEVVGIPSDERLAEYLETLGPAIPALWRIDREFHEQLPRGVASFRAAYPDLDEALPLYVGPSLFTSSGQVRDLQGRTIVFYGLDVMAVVLADVTDHLPDMHHELFHAYHWQRNPEIAAAGREAFSEQRTTPVYYDLWSEGLAVYAAHRLNPEAPLALLLSSPDLAEKGPGVLARVAGELRRRLDVTDLQEVGDYFFFRSRRSDLPSRSAYYVGLRLAEEVGRTRSMQEMIRLSGSALRSTIESELIALERAGNGVGDAPGTQ